MWLVFRIPIDMEAIQRKKEGTLNEKNNDKSMVKSNAIKIASKVQLNIAEYGGLLIAMLLYIQSEINRNKKSYTTGIYSIYAPKINESF